MKVKDLIKQLQHLEQEAEIRVLFPLPDRPNGGTLEPIFKVKPLIDQDTSKVNYSIDTGIGEEGRYEAYRRDKNVQDY